MYIIKQDIRIYVPYSHPWTIPLGPNGLTFLWTLMGSIGVTQKSNIFFNFFKFFFLFKSNFIFFSHGQCRTLKLVHNKTVKDREEFLYFFKSIISQISSNNAVFLKIFKFSINASVKKCIIDNNILSQLFVRKTDFFSLNANIFFLEFSSFYRTIS